MAYPSCHSTKGLYHISRKNNRAILNNAGELLPANKKPSKEHTVGTLVHLKTKKKHGNLAVSIASSTIS